MVLLLSLLSFHLTHRICSLAEKLCGLLEEILRVGLRADMLSFVLAGLQLTSCSNSSHTHAAHKYQLE